MALQKNVLVIEDDIDTRRLYVRTLQKHNYVVVDFEDGDSALAHLKKNSQPDLMLIDLNTPGMSTEDFLTEMRVALDMPTFPIMVVSGRTDIADKTQALGVHVYLRKPCDMHEFIKAVKLNCPVDDSIIPEQSL